MKLQLKGRVINSNVGNNGAVYVTMLDAEEGGQVKLSLPTSEAPPPDTLLNINAIVKPGIGRYGLYLSVVRLIGDSK